MINLNWLIFVILMIVVILVGFGLALLRKEGGEKEKEEQRLNLKKGALLKWASIIVGTIIAIIIAFSLLKPYLSITLSILSPLSIYGTILLASVILLIVVSLIAKAIPRKTRDKLKNYFKIPLFLLINIFFLALIHVLIIIALPEQSQIIWLDYKWNILRIELFLSILYLLLFLFGIPGLINTGKHLLFSLINGVVVISLLVMLGLVIWQWSEGNDGKGLKNLLQNFGLEEVVEKVDSTDRYIQKQAPQSLQQKKQSYTTTRWQKRKMIIRPGNLGFIAPGYRLKFDTDITFSWSKNGPWKILEKSREISPGDTLYIKSPSQFDYYWR